MSERWTQDFDVYLVTMEDKPASFVVDLAAAEHGPVDTHGLRLTIRVPMLQPRADGLRDASELDALGELEDRLCDRLEEAVDAIYAGRVVHGGDTTFFFYVPDGHRGDLDDLAPITGNLGRYRPEWALDEDPEWECYFAYLTPDPVSRQSIWNRRLLQAFEEGGDRLEEPREVDHLAYFPTQAQAEKAAVELRRAGFKTDDIQAPEEHADAWSLQFHRVDALSDGRPDEFCAEILDVILPLEGLYDGWGAIHVAVHEA